jgi:hypothetical protein
MNNKKRLALADKVQKRIQKEHPHFRLILKRDEIEKELKEKIVHIPIDSGHRFRSIPATPDIKI